MIRVPDSVLLAGFGVANRAAARALVARGHTAAVFDDRPGPRAEASARALGLELVASPDSARLTGLVRGVEMVLPTPGLPESHAVLRLAAAMGRVVASEFDLARVWDSRPVVAITGTSGKTTVTEMTAAALRSCGVDAVEAGNMDVPLVEAIEQRDAEVFVVEASSFRLAHSRRFEPSAGCWLNFAPDHLDVHRNLASYEAAKARLWRDLPPGATAVANGDDRTVMRHIPSCGPVWTFSSRSAADWHRRGDELVGPLGPVASVGELRRSLPHDLDNTLAAAATATAAGATAEGIREAFSLYEPGRHRIERVAVIDGVEYYDDSKATTPHAAAAAVRGFEAVVLLAGGRNKGLDLAVLADAVDRIHTVVAMGESADEVAEVFAGMRPVERAADMDEAVAMAATAAEPSTAVLLSPACASFDAYDGYAERGDDFARAVSAMSKRTLLPVRRSGGRGAVGGVAPTAEASACDAVR